MYENPHSNNLFFREILAHDRQGCDREVALQDVDDDRDKQEILQEEVKSEMTGMNELHRHEEDDGDEGIDADGLEVVGNRIVFFSDGIAQHHDDKEGDEGGPNSRHVGESWNEDNVDNDSQHESNEGEDGTIDRLISEFIPQREVVEDALKEVGSQDDRDDTEADTVTLVDE